MIDLEIVLHSMVRKTCVSAVNTWNDFALNFAFQNGAAREGASLVLSHPEV